MVSDESHPRTTVVIPVWDGYAGERLLEAIESVTSQSCPVRVVMVDNASTMPIPEVDGASVVRCPARVTLGAARNEGLSQVQTPYVLFWDADDVMLPGTIEFLEDSLQRDPRLVAFGMAIIEADSGLRHRWPRRWVGRLTRTPRLLAVVDCLWSVFPATGATLMRTEAVRDAGGYAARESGEDWCLGVSLVLRGRVGWSERPGRIYAQDPGSVWSRHSSPRHMLDHASAVRQRLLADPATPGWLRRLMPAIGFVQTGAVLGHLALARLRRLGAALSRG